MSIKLSKKHLQALLKVAAKSDVRYYLEGVCFRSVGSTVFAYASDGHRCLRWQVTDSYDGEALDVIISRNAIEQVCKIAAAKSDIYLSGNDGIMSIRAPFTDQGMRESLDLATISGEVTAKYPDVERAINTAFNTTDLNNDALLNPQYVADACAIAKLIGSPSIIHRSGTSNMTNLFLFDRCPDTVCAIMPMRHTQHDKDKPEVIETDIELLFNTVKNAHKSAGEKSE